MDCSVKTQLTPDDVVRFGACYDGVMDWLKSAAPNTTALLTFDALELCENDSERNHIELAAGMRGYGNGNGYGYGNGGITTS